MSTAYAARYLRNLGDNVCSYINANHVVKRRLQRISNLTY